MQVTLKKRLKVEKNFDRLRELERELGISESIIEHHGSYLYIKGDPWWNKTSVHITAYTLILRTISFGICNSWQEVEDKIQYGPVRGKLKKYLLFLKKIGYSKLIPYGKEENIYTIHNASGIYTMICHLEARTTSTFGSELVNAYHQ